MRIGTWNLGNKPLTNARRDLLLGQLCDVWLLTEVRPQWEVPKGEIAGFYCHLSAGVMAPCGQHWATVLSRQPLSPLPDPHPASAAAVIDGVTYCSTVLPWNNASGEPWVGDSPEVRTEAAIQCLSSNLPRTNLVWGGDWNNALLGSHVGATVQGRLYVLEALKELGLQVPTAGLPHQEGNCFYTIDQVAVSCGWFVQSAARVVARGLSDHDAYVIETNPYAATEHSCE